jgi:hypothetical protein
VQPEGKPVGEAAVEIEDDVDPATGTTHRDALAGPALMATFASLIVPLFLPYAIYLWFRAAFGTGRLSSNGKWVLWFSGLLLGLSVVIWLFVTTVILFYLPGR